MKATILFIYIDETSFNFDLWPKDGWAPRGKHPKNHKPGKSKNYSAIIEMDIKGILGVKIVKGQVKGADFFYVYHKYDCLQQI